LCGPVLPGHGQANVFRRADRSAARPDALARRADELAAGARFAGDRTIPVLRLTPT
jgi:hypothetical protein